jgi:putative ABC transport system substrate-binding protein
VETRTAQEIEIAFPTMTQRNASGLIVATDGLFIQHYRKIAELAAKNRLPSASQTCEYVEAGGLVSYGPNLAEQFLRAAAGRRNIHRQGDSVPLAQSEPSYEFDQRIA